MYPCFADLFSCVRGVSASPRAARASRARRGLAWAQLIASHFFVIQSREAMLCACCRDALCGAECAFDTCMRFVKPVRRACVRGSKFGQDASLTHVCSVP